MGKFLGQVNLLRSKEEFDFGINIVMNNKSDFPLTISGKITRNELPDPSEGNIIKERRLYYDILKLP